MQKITSLVSVAEIAPYMDEKVLNYIRAGQLESLDSYSSFAFWVFDWYDIHSEDNTLSKVMIYLDREDLFVICESERAEKRLSGIFKQQEEDALSNEQRLYHFLVGLLKGDMDHLVGLRMRSIRVRRSFCWERYRTLWVKFRCGGVSFCA